MRPLPPGLAAAGLAALGEMGNASAGGSCTDPTISSSLGNVADQSGAYTPTLTHNGASVATTAVDTTTGLPVVVTDSATTTPSVPEPTAGHTLLVTHTTTAADGLTDSISFAVTKAGASGGLTAPSSVFDVDFSNEGAADWSADTGGTRTVDGADFDSYGDSAETFGPDGSTGVVIEALNASGGTISGPGLELDIVSDVAQGSIMVATWRLTSISLPKSDDYVICEMFGTTSPARRGPGGGFWLDGQGKLYVVCRRTGSNTPLTATTVTLGSIPTSMWVRVIAYRSSGSVNAYYSTTAPSTTQLSGGMTYVGTSSPLLSAAASTTVPDLWPSLWLQQCRLYRGSGGGGSNATMTIESFTCEELAP